MKSWVGTGEGRARKNVCCVGMNARVFVMYYGNVQHIVYANFLQNLQECLGDSFSHFDTGLGHLQGVARAMYTRMRNYDHAYFIRLVKCRHTDCNLNTGATPRALRQLASPSGERMRAKKICVGGKEKYVW